MDERHVFRCEFGTVVAYGTLDQKRLEEGCRKAILMNAKSKKSKRKEGDDA